MAQVFISHSRHDRELVNNIKAIIENLGHQAYLYEYEAHPYDSSPDTEIMNEIRKSDLVFTFLTRNVDDMPHTKSWVISEVAIARDANKRTFVFEYENEFVSFPLPYLTDYMILDKHSVQDILTVQRIAKKSLPQTGLPPEVGGGVLGVILGAPFGPLGILFGGLGGAWLGSTLRPSGTPEIPFLIARCLWCGMQYNYYSPWVKKFPCPKCRRYLELR